MTLVPVADVEGLQLVVVGSEEESVVVVQDTPTILDRVVVDTRVVGIVAAALPVLLEDVPTRGIVLPSGSV